MHGSCSGSAVLDRASITLKAIDCRAGPCSTWQVSKNEDEMKAVAGSLDGIIDTVAGGQPLGQPAAASSHLVQPAVASLRLCASAVGASC